MSSSPFLLLHVLTMFTLVSLHSGPQFLAYAAARSGQEAAVGAIGALYARSGRAVPVLGTVGALFGVGAGLTGGFDFLAPWLLIAYGLFVAVAVFGGMVSYPYIVRMGDAARAGTPEWKQLAGRRLTLIVGLDAVLLVLIICDMVLKPFS